MTCEDLVKTYNVENASPRCKMKLDLKNAYDTVRWVFVEGFLYGLGFPARFIHGLWSTFLLACCLSGLVELCVAILDIKGALEKRILCPPFICSCDGVISLEH